MSHFAKLDSNNIVENVIVAEQSFINSGVVGDSFLWIQTSYNDNFRGKYATVGDTWDKVNEQFVSPQPFASWTLDANFCWQAPTARPEGDAAYTWDEDTVSWVEVSEE